MPIDPTIPADNALVSTLPAHIREARQVVADYASGATPLVHIVAEFPVDNPTTISAQELSFLYGATSNLQSQLDGKEESGTAASLLDAHVLAPDPHSGYLTPAEGNLAYSAIGHNHNLADLTEKSYKSLTDKPTIPSITGLLDETAHDLLDHTGLTGIPTAYTDEMAQDAVGAAIAAGTQTGIIVAYDDVNNKIDFTVNATGSGDVTGPASAVSDNIALFDGITGKIIKDSGVTTSNFAPALGVDDNYVTGVEKIKLANLSGVNTGDQDLSDYSLTSHLHTGIYEPADATILRGADIGVAVQAYDADLTSWAAIAPSAKQDTLVSGTNIKTINGSSVLGSGDLTVTFSVADGDKGNVTVSNSGATWAVDSVDGNLDFLGTAARIRGDFSNATIANRAMFQTSTVNAATNVGVIPNGTGAACSYQVWASSDPTNSALGFFQANSSTGQIVLASGVTGTGTYLPMAFHTGGSETLRLTTDKRIQADFSNATIANRTMFQTSTVNGVTQIGVVPNGTASLTTLQLHNSADPTNCSKIQLIIDSAAATIQAAANGTGTFLPMTFHTGGYERMRIDTSGNAHFKSSALHFGPSDNSVLYTDSNWGMLIKTATSAPYTAEFAWFKFDGTTELFRYDSTGFIVKQPSGLGYGIGAGGTVTQATSKSTAVTLNKPTGQITMNNAALAAGATIEFIVSNNLVGTNDVVVVSPVAGTYVGSAATYRVGAVAGLGYFFVTITNISGTSYSEAFKINFAVIKGATS